MPSITTRTQQQEVEAIRAMAHTILDAVDPSESHAMLLSALILAYEHVARTHACCTAVAATAAVNLGMRLAMAQAEAPSSASFH